MKPLSAHAFRRVLALALWCGWLPLATAGEPPMFVVTSADTLLASPLRHLPAEDASDSLGTRLKLVELDATQRAWLSDFVHEEESRCGGYFAFPSRAEALDFLARDRSLEGVLQPAAASYVIDSQPTVAPWLPQVSEANIHATIAHLSSYQNRYYQSSYGVAAAHWIRDTWLALGQGRGDVHVELVGCSTCSNQPSVILTIDGAELPEEVVVLGGHLDSIRSGAGSNPEQFAPGADDDASGIATLTEVLRIALADGWRPKRTVKLMGYAAEEVGLRGSAAIASQFQSAGINVVGVLQLDMTNYRVGVPYHLQFITDHVNATLLTFSYALFDTYLAPQGLIRRSITCGYACSDHASWTSKSFPAVMASESGDATYEFFPYLHTANDTLAYIGNTAASSVPFAQFGLAFLGELAKTAARPQAILSNGFEDSETDS
jgi:leucyl aminopeptidase